eukprot:TRINITY_DN4380_c0_g3_i5.p1 TRINITY_DN4380_c0_g3~~TRINITY_DN4380_c0_g3_i5.p1  ORF type:complete len:425 (-),score=108.56 TRINITY_DN4380_c0_g3_i5:158-1309(-)
MSSSAHTGTIKIFFNYTQTVSSVFSIRFPWPQILLSFTSGVNITNLNFTSIFGFECEFSTSSFRGGFSSMYYLYLLVPLVLLGVGVFVYIVGRFIRIFLVTNKKHNVHYLQRFTSWNLLNDFLRFELFALLLCYFPVARLIMSSFNCEMDPVTNIKYMEAAPYVPCNLLPAGEWLSVLPASVVLLVVYVVSFPTALLVLLIRNRASLTATNSRIREVVGFVYLPYKDNMYWFEFLIMLRSLLLSIFISLLPQSSSIRNFLLPVCIFVFLMLQVKLRPYRDDLDNRLEELSLSAIMMTFAAGMSFQAYSAASSSSSPNIGLNDDQLQDILSTGWLVLLLNVFVLFMFVLRVLVTFIRAPVLVKLFQKIKETLTKTQQRPDGAKN